VIDLPVVYYIGSGWEPVDSSGSVGPAEPLGSIAWNRERRATRRGHAAKGTSGEGLVYFHQIRTSSDSEGFHLEQTGREDAVLRFFFLRCVHPLRGGGGSTIYRPQMFVKHLDSLFIPTTQHNACLCLHNSTMIFTYIIQKLGVRYNCCTF
jgi:hypothetical protein